MKKLVLFAATIVAISFASCSGSGNTATTSAIDSAAIEPAVVETVVDSAAAVIDSVATTVQTVVAQ